MGSIHHDGNCATADMTFTAPKAKARLNGLELGALLKCDLSGDPSLAQLTFVSRAVRQGESLIHAGDDCNAIYVVRFGSFKRVLADSYGGEQGLGFPMAGDVIGVDGLATGTYNAQVVAFERSEVVVIPYPSELVRQYPALSTLLYRLISRELVRDQSSLYLVGALNAEGRVASFLLDLAQRFGDLGYSRSAFMLRMTRQEMAQYLGLKLETVSRMLSAFAGYGFIEVQGKQIRIVDPSALHKAINEPLSLLKKNAGGSAKRSVSRTVPQ